MPICFWLFIFYFLFDELVQYLSPTCFFVFFCFTRVQTRSVSLLPKHRGANLTTFWAFPLVQRMTLDVHQHPAQRRLKAFSSTLCPIIEEMLASSDQIDHNVGVRAASCSSSAGWNTAGVGRFARRICKTVHLPSKSLNSFTVWKEISRGFKYLNYHLCGQKVNVSYLIRVSDGGSELGR